MSTYLTKLSVALADRYRIEREVGAGGMATVYLAHDLKHDRDVAIKVLHPDLGAALGGERFLSEIRTTARLQHPHILPLLDSGEADGLLYYVMPLVTGETLRARLERERQLPIADAVRIAREVASALDYAHRQNVIHRDIKPENILLHDGSALVADFGIALAVQSAGGQRMTQTGLSLGTPQYMSPEQAMGERTIDARSDIYALGAVTYEMLVGDAPFIGSSVQAIVAKVLNSEPERLTMLRKTVSPQLEVAVTTALSKLPADRFASAAEFATALLNSGSTSVANTVSGATPARSLTRDPRTWVTATAVAASLALAAAYVARPVAAPGYEVRQQATYSGRAASPAISADGRFLAYLERRCPMAKAEAPAADGVCMHLMVVEVGGTRPIEVVTAAERLSSPRWTHDGLSIVFSGSLAGGRSGLFVVPRLGGIPRRLADESGAHDTHASADSVAMVLRRDTGAVVEIVHLTSGGASGARIPLAAVPRFLAWSPDGRTFALRTSDSVYIVGRDGRMKSAQKLTRMRVPVRWAANGRAIMMFQWTAGATDDLVALPVDEDGRLGSPRTLVSQLQTLYFGEFDVARGSGRVVVGSGAEFSDIWSFDLSSGGRAERYTQGTNWHGGSELTADGRALYYLRADQLGNSLYRIVDGVETALTAEPQIVNNGLRISLDGRTLTFESQVDSTPVLMVHDVAAGATRHVPRGPSDFAWFLSGKNRILWWNTEVRQLWTTDVQGRDRRELAARPIGTTTTSSGAWGLSPGGDAIATASGTAEATVLEVLPLDGGPSRELARFPLSEGAVHIVTWAREGTLYLVRGEESRATVFGIDAATGVRRAGFVFPAACDPLFVSFVPSARRAACTVIDRRLDLMLIDGVRP